MELWWNSTGIPLEYYHQFCPNLPHVFQNYSNEIPFIFWQKEPEFLWNFCGILMESLWYFLESGWYFDGIPVKKAMRKVLLAEFNRYFCGIFHVFSSCYTPKEHGKSPALSELNWNFDGNFTQLPLLIETLAEKS